MTAPEYPDWISALKDDPGYQAELAALRAELTAPDRDPVFAALIAIGRHAAVAGSDGGDATTYALADAALPLARAQAALIAAVEDTEGACQNCLMLSGFLSACGAHRALAEYRRAMKAK